MDKIVKYFSEIFMVKRQSRTGWKLAGLPDALCESVGEHEIVMAKIAYVLAKMEGVVDPEKCVLISVFHDDGEIRTGDQHKVSARYFSGHDAEEAALKDQVEEFPELISLVKEIKERNTKEGIVVKDADWLETALQAKIYMEQGYAGCEDWIINVEKALETDSAKKILAEIKNTKDFTNLWWQGLKKMTYKKLGE